MKIQICKNRRGFFRIYLQSADGYLTHRGIVGYDDFWDEEGILLLKSRREAIRLIKQNFNAKLSTIKTDFMGDDFENWVGTRK